MKTRLIAIAITFSATSIALTGAVSAHCDEASAHKLGDHPAVVVQRLAKSAGYDYASKFYPHPAWLHLYATQPGAEPAVAANNPPVRDPKPESIEASVEVRHAASD